MKKILHYNKYFMSLAALAVMAVGCGLKFTTIEVSNHNPETGDVITVTANLEPEADNVQHDNMVLLYAIRVPADWEGQGLVAEIDGSTVDMTNSQAYADFCQTLFPRDGYKWVGYQSKSTHVQGSNDKATVSLLVGNTAGEYSLDVIVGGWANDPKYLFNADGSVNIDVAFGHNYDMNDAVTENDGVTPVKYHSSEYLTIAGTMKADELAAADERLAQYKTNAYNKGELPVMTDVVNKNDTQDLSVTVKPGAGIDGVAADVANGPVEWFTLQGVRVERPEAGNVYIRRQGGEVSKVYVK